MGRRLIPGLVCVLAACGGDDPEKPEFSQRDASEEECISGGTVLLVDEEPAALICNEVTTETVSADLPELVQEVVYCSAITEDPAQPFRAVSYKHARLYDGSLFVSVNCDTLVAQDSAADIFRADQEGAASGSMNCVLLDETNTPLLIDFVPNFLTRRLVITENEVVVVDQGFDTDCTVLGSP